MDLTGKQTYGVEQRIMALNEAEVDEVLIQLFEWEIAKFVCYSSKSGKTSPQRH